MIGGRSLVAPVAVAIAVAAAGCGLGPGDSTEGDATLTVTRDYGTVPVLDVSQSDPPESETVIRFLDREAEITTRYGGGFVQSIDGVSGEVSAGRSRDWFFFVNGIESPRGGAEVAVRGGDRIWWDHRDWTDAMRTPAVVGSWPEPFAQASATASERVDVQIECFGPPVPCDDVANRLEEEEVAASVAGPGTASGDSLRLLVGTWERLRGDEVAAQLEAGPAESGVFARFEEAPGGWDLVALDERAREAGRLGEGAGLVAALRPGDGPATWVIGGVDVAGVGAAVELLDDDLAGRYAAVADGSGAAIPVPEVSE